MEKKGIFCGNFSIFFDDEKNKKIKKQKNIIMDLNKNTNNNLLELSNYLANIFIHCRTQLECPPVKIQKLILIMQIFYVKKFNTNCAIDINKVAYAACGFKIPDVVYYIPSIITTSTENKNSKLDLTELEFNELINCSINSANPLFDYKYVDEPVKKLLLHIFDNFAGYSANYLGDMLNPLKPNNYIFKYGDIDVKEFNSWINERYENIDNEIKQFIDNYNI